MCIRDRFGAGQLNELGKQSLPGKKALLLISNGKSTKANGYLERTEQQLSQAGVEYAIFAEIEPNPLKSTVMRGAAFARENGCDFIVALGGGSVMDASKALSLIHISVDALVPRVEEGRGQLRKASGSRKQALIRRFPNGATRREQYPVILW